MNSAKDVVDFSGAIEGHVLESHLVNLPKPDTLFIYMTRGESNVRESFNKVFGGINRVVIDVDGEKHEYDADMLIALLEGLESELRDATLGEEECKIIGSSTNNLMYPDYMTKWYELSCGHSVTLKGSEPPRFCPKCGKAVKQ